MNQDFISEYIKYLNASPTPYHATKECAIILEKSNFKRLYKIDSESIAPGKYYMKHNKTLLIAFTIPSTYNKVKKVTYPINIVATHNDSPVLKIKPRGICDNNNLVNLYGYGGGLWHTWFDRPLSIAGQIITENMECELIKIDKPLLYIPSLAIHLNNGDVYNKGFQYNKEIHLNAIYGTDDQKNILNSIIFNEKNVLAHDISLFDIQEAVLGGCNNEFIFSARQDNLLSTFCGLKAIADAGNDNENINVFAVFDHEEIGSKTVTGAETEIFKKLIDDFLKIADIEKSILVSCDVAHAYNPNYPEKYEKNHRPFLGDGMVIKYSNRYATNNFTAAFIKKLMGEVKLQEFVLRNDSCGGGTIGPMLVSGTGIKGIDIGAPILGMHSIKEVSHVNDIKQNHKLFYKLFMNSSLKK